MTSEEALYLLGLSTPADMARLRSAYDTKRSELTERLANAPTDGLRAKYQAALGELVQAYELLNAAQAPRASGSLSHTMMRDLPGAAPSFTQFGAGAAVAEELSAGTVLSERYEIVCLIGRGGMGAVYQAFDRLKQEDVAVKVLLPQLLSNERARERFFSEAKVACRLAHPHIVKVFDVGVSGPYSFMTMELLEGQTLRERMQAQKDSYRPFPVEWVIGYARQLIDALDYAHQWIVHRDLKPENIWVDASGHLKLMDFGIARVFSNTELTKTGMALGTAYYMAPEQLSGAKDIDGRADQYALGVVLYELLTGQIPQGAVQTPKQTRSEIPSALSAAVMKAMAPRPADRHPTLGEFGQTLERSQSLKNSPAVKWGAIAAAAVSVVAVLLASGALGSLWDAVRPVSKAELQAQQLEAVRLQAQVKEGLKSLDDSYKELQSRLRSAQDGRNGNSEEAQRLAMVLARAEEQVFRSAAISSVRTEASVADQLLRDRDYPQAIALLKPLQETLSQQQSALASMTRAPEIIEVDFDGLYVWNSYPQTLQQLEARWTEEARRGPLPELRIRPHRTRAQYIEDLQVVARRSGFQRVVIDMSEPGVPTAGSTARAAPPSPPPRPTGRTKPQLDRSSASAPEYPPGSRRRGETGTAIVNVVVGTNGRPLEASINTTTGYPALDDAAVQAVMRWRFKPAMNDGVPAQDHTNVAVKFTLDDGA